MSTTTQEQNHLPSEEHNHNETNFVKNDKSEANETNPVKEENHVLQKEHDEPKQNQQMPDQSGTSLTEKVNSNAQNEKLPEPHSNHSNPESSQKVEQNLVIENEQPKETKEEVIHQKEKEVTPSNTHSEDKEKEHIVEKDNNLPVIHKEENEVTPSKTHPGEKEKDENLAVPHKEENEETLSKFQFEEKEKVEKVEKENNSPVPLQEQKEVTPSKTHPEDKEKEHDLPAPHKEEKEVTLSKTHPEEKEKDKNLPVPQKEEKKETSETLPESKEKVEKVEKDKNLPAPHKAENEVTPSKTHSKDKEKEHVKKKDNLPVSHKEEKKETPKTLPESKEKVEKAEKDKNLPASQDEKKSDAKPIEVEKNTPKHENKQQAEPEIVHKDEDKPIAQENDNDVQPSSQQDHNESLENQNPQDRTNENDVETPKNILQSNAALANPQAEAQEELEKNLGSIVNFFSTTKDNLIQSTDQVVAKLGDIISNSKLGSIIQGHEYTPVITSDHIIKTQETEPVSTGRRKSGQTDQTPKLRNASIDNPLKVVKSPKKTTLPNKTHIGSTADSKTFLSPEKSLTKIQPQTTKQPEFKNRNEIEEQIRQHKIQEILKQRKALEMKLGSLNEQLVELQKVELSSSPNRSKSKPKESREEFLERKKKAVEFAKKMNQEQKNIDLRNDQRREARQVLVNKEIEALQKLADKKYDRKKIMDFIKGQTEVVQKAKYGVGGGLSSLEEKKLELKQKREFDKEIDHVRDSSEHEQPPHKLTQKSSSKKIYKSPMLPQVLAHDAEVKKVESEKIAKRKALHDKQVDYGRGVKDVFLPKVQSKFEARKLKMGVYKSQQVEAQILRSGKDGLYGYLDKMKNDYEVPKYKKKSMKQHHDDDFDRPPTDFADDEEQQNVNVAYGKQLVYELQDNWNLADGTMSSRKKHLSPRNPEVNSKYTIKHKKEKELMIDGDHLSDTEQSVHAHAKRAEPRYDDEEEDY